MSPITEIWKDIPNYPYQISNIGRIRRSKIDNDFARNTHIGRVLKPNIDKYGYQYIILCKNGITKTFKIHKLMCEVFYGPPNNDQDQVRHLDGNKLNNILSNLLWGNAQNNADDRDSHGTTVKGELNWKAKFTNVEVKQMREYINKLRDQYNGRVPKGTLQKLAKKYNAPRNTISCIVQGRGYNA